MAILAQPLHLLDKDATFAPIPGNQHVGGACYAGDGQALYAVWNGDQIQAWRTRDGLQKLWTENSSVDYVSTIATGPFQNPTSVALTRINGTIYASVAALRTNATAGWHRIYRDTSPAANGAGPWVLHGSITEGSGFGSQTAVFGYGGFGAGEITVMPSGMWVTPCVSYEIGFAGYLQSAVGVATSADGGLTWTVGLKTGTYRGALSVTESSRNLTLYNGATYWAWATSYGTGASEVHKSTDLAAWTNLGDLGVGFAGSCFVFPAADKTFIYRMNPTGYLEYAQAPPETMPPWTIGPRIAALPNASGGLIRSAPLLCQVGPEASPAWVLTNSGQVLGIAMQARLQKPCRRYPREDGLASSSAPRLYPPPRSRQGGYRKIGYY